MSGRGRRSADSLTSDRTPAKKAKKDKSPKAVKAFATTYFEEIIQKAGITLNEESHHTLRCEPLKFSNELKSILENNVDFPRNVVEFVRGLENYTGNDKLQTFLTHNVTVNSEDGDENRIIQSSVLRLLLDVNCLQENLVDYVVRRAVQFAIDEKADLVQMILKPFILLDNLVDETKLVKGLVEILDVSGHLVRLEVIICLPDIITQREHHTVALELCRFMQEDYELTPAILDCLSYFCLPNDLKLKVRDQMLAMLKTSAPLHLFPNLVNFFLVGCATEHDADVIDGLREGLDWTLVGNTSSVDVGSSQIMTIMSLKLALSKSKSLASAWLKIINRVKVADEHKPLDLIILLIIFSTKNGKEKIIENIFRKRIKLLLFTCSLIKSTLKKFKPVMNEYLQEILQLSRSLLRTRTERAIREFSIYWITLLFKELAESRRTILNELIHQEFIEEQESLANSLIVLTKIAENDIEALKPFSLQILALVNKLEILQTDDVCRVMNLLCALAFSVENSLLQDDVHMIIRKQLSSSDLMIKTRGIAAGVMAVKHMVCSKEEQEPPDDKEYSHVNQLPDGDAKEAAIIVELILRSTVKFPEIVCFFYDEFANMLLSSKNVDAKFLSWLTNLITNDFQAKFIVDVNKKHLQPINGITLSEQFCLEKIDDPIALNIGNLILGSNPENVDLRTLPSYFRVLQTLHKFENKGDLSSIDNLLGCGIIMPVVGDENFLEEFDSDHADKILNCLVHSINWFRELICAFSLQDDTQMKIKVFKRLNELLELEKKIAVCLSNVNYEFKPPISIYGITHNTKTSPFLKRDVKIKAKVKKPGKSKKNAVSPDGETSAINDTLRTQGENTLGNVQLSYAGVKCKLNSSFFRNIQFEVINFFQQDLSLDEMKENEPHMSLDSLIFLLDEINPKLSAILPSFSTKHAHPFTKSIKYTFVMLNATDAISQCLEILPRLCLYMEKIAKHIQKCLEDSDGVRDALLLFTEKNAKAQICLANIFNMLTIIFSWSGFKLNENKSILISFLKIFANKHNAENSKKISLRELISDSCMYFSKYKDWCLLISTAASLVNFLRVLTTINNEKNVIKNLISISLEMLSTSWKDIHGDSEKGLHFNRHVDTLLSGYFSSPDISVIKSLSIELHEQCSELTNKNQVLTMFQCINKTNFPLLYRTIWWALFETTRNELEKGLTDKQHLELWKEVVISMKALTEIVKVLDSRNNLAPILKQSIPLLKLFLSQGMPILEMKLKTDPDAVVEILRTLQHSTRFLQSLHLHVRLKKDNALMSYFPQLKLLLETLIYKVKATLIANKCSEVFWMGNLKNKNLQGEIISSQNTIRSESDDEEQLPEDEHVAMSDSEDTINDDMKSVSNVF